MEETFHRLAQDTRREQTHRIKLKGRAFHSREVHHPAGKSDISILKNEPVCFDDFELFEDFGGVRGNDTGAETVGLRGSKVVHQDFAVLCEQQATISEIVKDRIHVVPGVNKDEVKFASLLEESGQDGRGRSSA